MKVRVDPQIERDEELSRLVSQANELLGQILATRFGKLVDVAWGLAADDRGRPVLRLQLSGFSSSVVERFNPEDLEDSRWLSFRLRALWDSLLEIRSNQLLESILSDNGDEGSPNASQDPIGQS